MKKIIKIGIAELNVAKAPDALLTSGLGSCVGICLYDQTNKIAGMAHIMLPNSQQARANENKAKFADSAVPLLLEKMTAIGATPNRLIAKIAGGAQMFNFAGISDIMRIGERNVEATKEALKLVNIRIVAEDVGGNFGRTIEFCAATGQLSVRTIDKGEKAI